MFTKFLEHVSMIIKYILTTMKSVLIRWSFKLKADGVYKSPNNFNFETLFSCYVASKRFVPWPTWISILGKAHLKMEYSEFIQKVERPRSSKMMLFLYMAWVAVLHRHGQRKRKSMKMENLFPKESIGLINGSPEI